MQTKINTKKKDDKCYERKTIHPRRGVQKSIVNKSSFRVLSILYITNFCETRKINSNAIRVLFLLLNFGKSRK